MSISDERLREIADNSRVCSDRADRGVVMEIARELLHLRASSNAKAREELEDLRAWCEDQRDDWKREADRAPAKIIAASCAMAAGSFGTAMEEIDKRLAALPPSPRATQGGEAEQV